MKFFAFVVGIVCWSGLLTRAEDLTDAAAILDRCEAAYTHCETCSVEGQISEEFHTAIPNTNVKDMRLWFARPGKLFRLDWTETQNGGGRKTNSVFTRDGQTYFFWGSLGRFEHPEDLQMALAGATGISSGLAHFLPEMLVGRGGTVSLKNLEFKTGETLDGRACYVVAGLSRFGDEPTELAVDKESFAVARVKVHRHIDGHTSARVAEKMKAAHPDLAAKFAAEPPMADFDVDSVTTYKTTFDAPVTAANCDYPVPAGMSVSEKTR